MRGQRSTPPESSAKASSSRIPQRDGGAAAPAARLIEALTCRLSDHTTADDARRYRDDVEVSRHWPEDPLRRLREHLAARGARSRPQEEAALHEADTAAQAAAEAYLATPPQDPGSIFAFTHADPTAELRRQQARVFAEEAQ